MSGSDVDGTGGIGETSQGPGRPRRTAIERKKPIGIAYVLPGLGYGGTEKHVRDLSARLDRARFSPILICTGGNDLLPRELDGWDIPVYPLHYRGASVHPGKALPLARDAVSFFRSFRRILAKHRTGIVHAYLPAANILGMIASSFAGIRVRIVSKRALCRYKDGHSVYSFFENLANLAADVILVTFIGGTEGTQLDRVVIDGDKKGDGLTEGDAFLWLLDALSNEETAADGS